MDPVSRNIEPDPSHIMSEWKSTIAAPAGTARFYSIRHCKQCGGEHLKGNGNFIDECLLTPCDDPNPEEE